ncbi:MAG: alcohol dehydrogenase catalytic domain-containing protein [Chloroflexi bacterium]|nr:alcohol dehydrogenase catalytic domain-containing protein [Chloroflexota bacterium]
MKALRLFGPHDLRLVEEPRPVPLANEALLRVRAVTICHSDIHYYRDGRIGDTKSTAPLVLGHEFAGEVLQVPQAATHLHIGDLVAVEPAVSCGHCRECREGNPNICANLLFSGTPPLDGALREYITYRPEFCFPLPADFTPEEGALLEPLGVALYAWDLGHLRLAESVAIIGCGPIGLLLVQLARQAGAAHALAVEPLAYRRNMAAMWGGIPLIPDDNLENEASRITEGHGVDLAIETAGTLEGQEEAVRLVKRGGTVLLVGIPPEDRIDVTHHIARRKDLNIHVVRRMKHTYPRAITLVQRGMVELSPLITHSFPLAQAAEAFPIVSDYADEVIKAVITP